MTRPREGWLVAAGAAGATLGLSVVPLPWLVSIVALAALVAAPALGLAAAAASVPFGGRAAVPLGAAALTPAPLLLGAVAYVWLVQSLAARRLPQLPPGRVRWVLAGTIAFVGALVLSALRAPDLARSAFEIARWAEFALAALLGAAVAGRRPWLWLVAGALLAAGAVEAWLGVRAAAVGSGPEAFAIVGGGGARAYGSFGQPNPFGAYMNLVWPLGVALALGWHLDRGVPGPVAALGFVAAAAGAAGLLQSWSRGAWLAGAAAGLTMFAVWALATLRPPVRPRAAVALWLVVVAALAGLVFGPGAGRLDALAARFEGAAVGATTIDVTDAEVDDASFSTVERLAHWQAAARMFEDSPWLGQGPGQYELAYARYRLPRWEEPLGHAHNTYLNVLAEAGLVGLAGYGLFLGSLVAFALATALRPEGRAQAAFGLALCGSVTAVAVHGVVDNVFVHDMVVHLGLLVGLAAGAGAGTRR